MSPDASDIEVRDLTGADRAHWDPLWREYLEFYEQELEDEVTEVVFQRIVDPDWPTQRGYVALYRGDVMGFAHVLLHPSTRSSQDDCFLEDLYISPKARGNGLGRAILEALTEQGCDVGWRRIHWLADQDDEIVRELYDDLGTATGQGGYQIEL